MACLGLCLSSCAEPRYTDSDGSCYASECDGSVPSLQASEAGSGTAVTDASSSDASRVSSVTDAATSAAGLLLGSYAVRVRFHARQPSAGLYKLSEEAYLLADVQRANDGTLQLRTQVCDQHSVSTSTVAPEIDAQLSYAQFIPGRTFALIVQDGTFHTEGPALEIGYTSAPPAGCASGATIAGRADQPWLANGQCTCASSSDPPTNISDCRIIDADRDGNPGMTVRFSGLVERTDYVRRRDASQLVSGSIAGDLRHTAQYQSDTQNYVLNCQGSGCVGSEFVDCPASQNRAQFAPLAALAPSGSPYACPDVLREIEAGMHFSPDPIVFPAGC